MLGQAYAAAPLHNCQPEDCLGHVPTYPPPVAYLSALQHWGKHSTTVSKDGSKK